MAGSILNRLYERWIIDSLFFTFILLTCLTNSIIEVNYIQYAQPIILRFTLQTTLQENNHSSTKEFHHYPQP